jgi:hypothetical protein
MAFDKVGFIPGNETNTSRIVALLRQVAERINGLSAFVLSFLGFSNAASAFGYILGMTNGQFVLSAAASALTIALKTNAGTDPSSTDKVTVFFRNVTGTTGDVVALEITAATSLVISSGSTLGITSSTAFRLWIVGFNDGGTFRIGAIQRFASGRFYPLVEGLASSTAEGGAGGADSAGVIYTGSAVSSKAMRILAYAEWNVSGLTAGTWTTTNLSLVQLVGPGVYKPGDVVQVSSNTVSGQITTTNTTFTATGLSTPITPTSAANVMLVSYDAMLGQTDAGVSSFATVERGGTPVGGEKSASAGGGYILSNSANTFFDWPMATSEQTYEVYYKTNSPGTAVFFTGTTTAHISVTEIMV